MLTTGVESLRCRLASSVDELARVPSGQPADGVSAFNEFRRAVIQASSGKGASPSELLEALEPKEPTLRFLLQLHEQKPRYRKQVAAVFAVLLQDDSWHHALSSNEVLCAALPADLNALLEEAVAARTPPRTPRGCATAGDQGETSGELRSADDAHEGEERERTPSHPSNADGALNQSVDSEDVRSYIASMLPAAKPSTSQGQSSLEASSERLEQARGQIAALGFSAVSGDEAITAFEAFRRVVLQIMRSERPRERASLEAIEPKDQILEFLVDFNERQKKYRSRVVATLVRLLTSESWSAAAHKDPSVRAALQDLVDDSDAPQTGATVSVGSYVNWQSAAAAAVARGGVGALYIKVIAGYNLIAGDSNGLSDPYVRVTLGRTTKRTEVITDSLNPRWNIAPFIFEVPAEDSIVTFDVFDSDYFNIVPLGKVNLHVRDLPARSSPSTMRCRLAEVPHGELEFDALFINGRPSASTSEPPAHALEASRGSLPTPWGPCLRPPHMASSPSGAPVAKPTASAGYSSSGAGNPWGRQAPPVRAPMSASRSPWGQAPPGAAPMNLQRHDAAAKAASVEWLSGPAAPAPVCEMVAPDKLASTNPFRPQLSATK